MPPECDLFRYEPEPFEVCPKCGSAPFQSVKRGWIQRPKRFLWILWKQPYCAIVCSICGCLIGHEYPPEPKDDDQTFAKITLPKFKPGVPMPAVDPADVCNLDDPSSAIFAETVKMVNDMGISVQIGDKVVTPGTAADEVLKAIRKD